MKRSIFERIVYDVPEWITATLVYGVGGSLLMLVMFGLPSCAPFEPVPGLCYTDKTGTYLCPKEEAPKIEKKKYTAKELCSPYLGTDWWFECMNNES